MSGSLVANTRLLARVSRPPGEPEAKSFATGRLHIFPQLQRVPTTRAATTAIMAKTRERKRRPFCATSPSNLFRRQSAAKLLGADPAGYLIPSRAYHGGGRLVRALRRLRRRSGDGGRSRARNRWPQFVKRHHGGGTRLSRGLHSALSRRRGILKFRCIFVERGSTARGPLSKLYFLLRPSLRTGRFFVHLPGI